MKILLQVFFFKFKREKRTNLFLSVNKKKIIKVCLRNFGESSINSNGEFIGIIDSIVIKLETFSGVTFWSRTFSNITKNIFCVNIFQLLRPSHSWINWTILPWKMFENSNF